MVLALEILGWFITGFTSLLQIHKCFLDLGHFWKQLKPLSRIVLATEATNLSATLGLATANMFGWYTTATIAD